MMRARPPLYLLLLSSLCGPLNVAAQSSTLVFRPTGLAQALVLPSMTSVGVSGQINLTSDTWPAGGVTIPSGRHVTVFAANETTGNAIDFGGIASAISVQTGARLEFRGLFLTHPAPQRWAVINDTYLINTAFAALPSINAAPNATVVYNNVSTEYYSAYSGNTPEQFTVRVSYAIQQLGSSVSSNANRQGNSTIVWKGINYMTLSASVNTTASSSPAPMACSVTCVFDMPGTNDLFNLTVIDSNATCVVYTAPPASARGFPWWAGLILGLGLAIILCMAAAGLLLWLRRRKRRRADATAAKALPQHTLQTVTNPMQLASPFNVGPSTRTGQVPDDSAMIVPKFSSAPGDGNSGKPPLERQATASAPPDVYEANMKINAMPMSGAVLPGRNPEDGQEGQRSSGYDKTSASSSIGSQRLGRSSAGAPAVAVPELFRQRSHMPLDEVELGPLLGRGAYGRVFKGRWKGALVAVKVIDHRIKGNGNSVDIQREAILSTSVVHPNVVSTYKIVTVNATRQMVDDARSSSQGTSQQPRLTSHPEGSATVQDTALDDELHQVDGPDEMQTWMLLEYCDRGSMEKACEQNRFMNKLDGKPDMVNIYKSLQDIAAGMDYLHTVGVVHGDLKGANVLLKSTATDPRGFMCKLADFGLSRVLDLDMTHISTHTYGTISYMPPELLSQGKMTRACDVYSFGMLMWEMYTGSSLFKGLTVGQVFFMVVYEAHRPAIPEDCPEAFVRLMSACWSANPADRPMFEQITKELQVLYQESRKKPLQSASSAPTTLEQKLPDRRSTGPPPPASGPLRVRPSTADISDLTPPKVGRSAFKSVTEPQGARPRSRIQSVAELDEQGSVYSGRDSQAPQQAPAPPTAAGASSPFADVAAPEQPSANGMFAREVPTTEEAKQRLAAAPSPFVPPASEMSGNASSSTSWRGPPASQQT
ncbi:hypothetical protein ABBQ38_007295 [Trebouxia sp. C0009 RCD-2024]